MQTTKRIGLALGGGAVRGLAHIGVLDVLIREGIPIDYVAGTSVGSLIGAAFCTGLTVEQIIEVSKKVNWFKIIRPHWGSDGIVSFSGIRTLVDDLFDSPMFEDLNIPFAVVTTDIDSDTSVVLTEGKLGPAVEASCSIAGLVAPVAWQGKRLADGVFVNSIPVSVVREMGADYVIGVDILKPWIRPYWGFISHLINALEIVLHHSGGGVQAADSLISPAIGGFTYMRFSKRNTLIELGRQAAILKLSEIKSAIFD